MIGRVGVCSWSLQPKSPADLAEMLAAIAAGGVQLALDPIRIGAWQLQQTTRALAGIPILSGMIATKGEDYSTLETIRSTGGLRPNEHWPDNHKAARENARIAAELGLSLVTFHAGFLPHDRNDSERPVLLDRLRIIADEFAKYNVRLGLETGQETAATLTDALHDLARPTVGVNFDPANMILYGMGDPADAIGKLAPRVLQVHVKDALPTTTPGSWGTEVRAGDGAVNWSAFFQTIAAEPQPIDILIEREAGNDRAQDIRHALDLVQTHTGKD